VERGEWGEWIGEKYLSHGQVAPVIERCLDQLLLHSEVFKPDKESSEMEQKPIR
jgi:hypothetical protein